MKRGVSNDKTVRLWDVARRRPLGRPPIGHNELVPSVASAPTARRSPPPGDDGTVWL
jgi:WD40 repeat protein